MTTERNCSGIRRIQMPQMTLEKIAMQNDITMLDTCTIMQSGFPSVISSCAKKLSGTGRRLGLHCSVINELAGIRADPRQSRKDREAANERLRLISGIIDNGTIGLIGKCSDAFFDECALEYALSNRRTQKIAIITQDRKLSDDLLMMNTMGSVEGKPISVFRLTEEKIITYISGGIEMNTFTDSQEITYIDRSAILSRGFIHHLRSKLSEMQKEGKCFVIHSTVRKELEELADSEGEYGKTIRNSIHNIDILSKNGILSFYGNVLEPFSSEMQCIKTVILARTKNKIRLITDDQNLAEDVLMLNGLNSCIGFPATVCRFAEDGSIEEWEAEEDDIRAENEQDDIFGRLMF